MCVAVIGQVLCNEGREERSSLIIPSSKLSLHRLLSVLLRPFCVIYCYCYHHFTVLIKSHYSPVFISQTALFSFNLFSIFSLPLLLYALLLFHLPIHSFSLLHYSFLPPFSGLKDVPSPVEWIAKTFQSGMRK